MTIQEIVAPAPLECPASPDQRHLWSAWTSEPVRFNWNGHKLATYRMVRRCRWCPKEETA